MSSQQYCYSSSLFFVVLITLSNCANSAKSGVKTGATVLAEENTSLFDYVHDNNFCLVVILPVMVFDMLMLYNLFRT